MGGSLVDGGRSVSEPDAPAVLEPVQKASSGENLDRALVHGIAWTGAARAVTQALSWASTLIVVHLLAPSDYGLVGMAALYLGLVRLVSEFGLGVAVLARRDLTHDQIRQLNSFAVLFGIAGFAVSAAAAVPLSVFFHAPALPAVILASSTVSVFSAFRSVPAALLQRDMRFKDLSVIEMARAIVSVATVITLAALGFGYWSLVWNEVLATIAASLFSMWLRPTGFQWPRWNALGAALNFSGQVLMSRLAWYTYSNADFLVAGKFLGEAALGAYTIAWTLTNMPVEKVTTLVLAVTPTFFSRAQHDNGEISRYLLLLTEGLAVITFPVAVGIALTAHDFVYVVLGAKWSAAIGPLQLLAIYTSVRSITPLVNQALTMTGRARHVMLNSIWSAVVFPPAFWIGSHWGPTGIAAAWAIIFPFFAVHLYRHLFSEIGLAPSRYFRALGPALAGCGVMAIGVILARLAMPAQVPLVARFAAEVCLGAAAYGILLLTRFRSRMVAFRNIVRLARA